MTWVKVCGITDERSLEAAVEGGADAVGFVLYPGSPRYLAMERAAALIEGVPIATFVVTVDFTPAEALEAAEYTGAVGIQNHGLYATDVAAVSTCSVASPCGTWTSTPRAWPCRTCGWRPAPRGWAPAG